MPLKWMLTVIFLFVQILFAHAVLAETGNPCFSPFQLLNTVDRPTASFSPCTTPVGKVLFEMGYQYQKLAFDLGFLQGYPNLEARFGLPDNTEVMAILPSVVQPSKGLRAGATALTVGLKHEFFYTDKFIFTMNGLILPPSGSKNFGEGEVNAITNAIFCYAINTKFSLAVLAGLSTQTTPIAAGGQRYNSFNPDAVLTYAPSSTLNLYAEVYGQTNAGPNQGSGYNINVGLLYLFKPTIVLDLEATRRLSGYLGGFDQFVGAGLSVLL